MFDIFGKRNKAKIDRASRTFMMEHLALSCDLDLHGFCERFRKAMSLPAFEYDAENITEWGLVEVDNVEYNVSKPYDQGTLENWDKTVPPGCNFGISLVMYREHPHAADHEWAFENLVLPVGQKIADEFGVTVHYHRTWIRSNNWFGDGKNVKRKLDILPGKNRA